MLSLTRSQRFQEEYNTYKEVAASVTDESVKRTIEGLLSRLVGEIKIIDSQHIDILSNKNAVANNENKDKILEIRRQLDRIVKDWRESQISQKSN